MVPRETGSLFSNDPHDVFSSLIRLPCSFRGWGVSRTSTVECFSQNTDDEGS